MAVGQAKIQRFLVSNQGIIFFKVDPCPDRRIENQQVVWKVVDMDRKNFKGEEKGLWYIEGK